jgi:hypothetical protein
LRRPIVVERFAFQILHSMYGYDVYERNLEAQ